MNDPRSATCVRTPTRYTTWILISSWCVWIPSEYDAVVLNLLREDGWRPLTNSIVVDETLWGRGWRAAVASRWCPWRDAACRAWAQHLRSVGLLRPASLVPLPFSRWLVWPAVMGRR